jgi:hypothetical protein
MQGGCWFHPIALFWGGPYTEGVCLVIAPIKKCRSMHPRWHKAFLVMLPAIVIHAKIAFRHLRGEARQDAIQETIANALVAFVGLVCRGKMSIAYPTVLAKYAVAQINDGRRVGSRLNVRDVSSAYCRRRKKITVERLDHFDEEDNQWLEAVVEDPHTPVFDQVCFRVDFPAWLNRLSRRNRRIAKCLALGNPTCAVAKRFQISPARISQLRREFYESWQNFCGYTDLPSPAIATTPC